MEANIASLMVASPPEITAALPTWTGEWAFLDTTRDTLLSYAYSRQSSCSGLVPARCDRPLGPVEIAAALTWYRHMTVETGAMPDVAAASPAERARIMVNWQSVGRRAALWVDEPVNFEHQLQFWRVGVVPFPGSDRFDGNTPFWVHGSFISQSSERPLDVWRWLVFLSERPVVGPLRYVPARPSVAEQTNYWGILPPPLREAMRTAFPFARPVTFDDREQFGRAQLEAVTSGALTPEQAARMDTPIDWFGRSSVE
jgi:ABC-type glycerol-3-phosphate transport system substrate-binding protein